MTVVYLLSHLPPILLKISIPENGTMYFRNSGRNHFPKEDISVKSKPSKIVYKAYEVFCICRDVFFEEDVEKEPENFMAECLKCGNVAFAFDKCLFSTHFLFGKS